MNRGGATWSAPPGPAPRRPRGPRGSSHGFLPVPCHSRSPRGSPREPLRVAGGSRGPRGWVPLLLAALAATACARNEAPTGGPEDRFPPYVVATLPDTFSTIEPGTREVRFDFSERISEQPISGRLNDAVVVSPSTGEIRVKHRREGITVRMREGFAPGLVYRVTVLPVIKDMFGNALPDAFDLVFSTGGEIVPNVIAGMVEDRVTGEATPDARVAARFVHGDDTITHWNFSDTAGVFSLRYVPEGTFEVRAWQDMNRDGEVGGSEPQTSFLPGEITGVPDTTLAVLTLVQPDTTPPRLTRATVEDSVRLKIEIDDYIEPELEEGSITGVVTVVALDTVSADEDSLGVGDTAGVAVDPGDTIAARVAGEPEDTLAEQEAGDPEQEAGGPEEEAEKPEPVPLPEIGDTIRIRIFQEHEYKVWAALREDSIKQAREDSIAEARQAEAAEDSVGGAGQAGAGRGADRARGRRAAAAGRGAGAGQEAGEDADTADGPKVPRTLSGLRLPARSLVGVLEGALVDRVEYELVVEGVVNIAGVAGGGGVDTLTWEPAVEEKDSAQAGDSVQMGDSAQMGDSVQISDTAQADDTATVPADTVEAGDTTTASPDTAEAEDTTTVPPDTAEAEDTTTVPPDTAGPEDTTTPPDTTGNPPDTTGARSETGRNPADTGQAFPVNVARPAAGLRPLRRLAPAPSAPVPTPRLR